MPESFKDSCRSKVRKVLAILRTNLTIGLPSESVAPPIFMTVAIAGHTLRLVQVTDRCSAMTLADPNEVVLQAWVIEETRNEHKESCLAHTPPGEHPATTCPNGKKLKRVVRFDSVEGAAAIIRQLVSQAK